MTTIKIIFFVLMAIGLSSAAPINSESYPGALISPPIYVQDINDFGTRLEDETYPATYAVFVARLSDSIDSAELPASRIEKRNAKVSDLEDLETAAGTNAIRPLFVYRQQVAYRQRIREAIRRANHY